jgi:hypothetical protein
MLMATALRRNSRQETGWKPVLRDRLEAYPTFLCRKLLGKDGADAYFRGSQMRALNLASNPAPLLPLSVLRFGAHLPANSDRNFPTLNHHP